MLSFSDVRSDGYRENSNYLRNSLFLNINHSLGEKLSGESAAFRFPDRNAQIPSSVDSATFVSDPRAAAPSWLKTGGNKTPGRIMLGIKLITIPQGPGILLHHFSAPSGKMRKTGHLIFLMNQMYPMEEDSWQDMSEKSGSVNYKITAGSNLFFELYNNSISENPGGIG